MQHQTIRRVLLAGAFTAAAAAGMVLADQAAAHADDKPAVVEQPGGLLDHTVRLPEQAAARAKAAVEQATEPTPEPTPVEPTPADAPAPVEERAPAPDPTTDAPPVEAPVVVETPPAVEPAPVVDTPPADVPPAEVPPADVPPLPTPSAPSTSDEPPVVTLPSIDPAPLPDAEAPTPAPVTVPEVGALPVTIGPVPATAPPAAPVDQLVAALTSTDPAVPAYCADEPDGAGDVNGDPIRDLIASLTDPAATPRAKPAPGCPSTPDHPAADGAGTTSVAATGHTAGPQGLADVTAGIVAPTLARLKHARARSTIPAGRHTSVEPDPA